MGDLIDKRSELNAETDTKQAPMSSEPPALDVVLLPATVTPESLAGKTVIVVDVLRATTTITHAIHNGCVKILPQPSVEAARDAYQKLPPGNLLGGERGGRIVDGFTNGNSPIEYNLETTNGKTLVLATTNGTVAMEHCRLSKRVLIGAMVNLGAVAELVLNEPHVTVLCSGTDRVITSEDVLFAGALMERLIQMRNARGVETGTIKDTTKIAMDHWKNVNAGVQSGVPLADFFRKARGGVNLVKIGHDPDIVFASKIDTVPVVGELNLDTWSIERATDVP